VSSQLPLGTVAVTVLDANDQPLAGVPLTFAREAVLGTSTSDANGEALLGVPTGPDLAVTATYKGGRFPIQIIVPSTNGVRVRLHAYPSTTDLDQTLLVFQGIVTIERLRGKLRIESSFRSYVFSNIAFRADFPVKIPPAATSFTTSAFSEYLRVQKGPAAGVVRVVDTIPPGQREALFSYEVNARDGQETRLELGMPPHLAAVRVIYFSKLKTPVARLAVTGFDNAKRDTSGALPGGLITERQLRREEEPLRSVQIVVK
jgi:hypothetical protein